MAAACPSFYYLALVTPAASAGGDATQAQTFPIMVLAIDKACCAPGYKKCESHPPTPDLHYLGVGFDRNGTGAGDSFNSPAYNAFKLTSSAEVPGDWNAVPGCFAFPGIGRVPNRFCGSLLMDVGTPEMFLELNPRTGSLRKR